MNLYYKSAIFVILALVSLNFSTFSQIKRKNTTSKSKPAITATKIQDNSVNDSTIDESKFNLLKLPLNASVKVPNNWRVFDKETNAVIEKLGELVLNQSKVELPAGKKINLFRANSLPITTYAAIAVNSTDSDLDANLLKKIPSKQMKELVTVIRKSTEDSFSGTNIELLEFYGVTREFVNNHPALTTKYKRSGLNGAGPVIVQMTRLYLGKKVISLNLSYRESELETWIPVINFIRNSLTVK